MTPKEAADAIAFALRLDAADRDMVLSFIEQAAVQPASPVRRLPQTPGAIIVWDAGAYLPRIAIRDPETRGRSAQPLGWWTFVESDDPEIPGDDRWVPEFRLQELIGAADWRELVRKEIPR